MRSHLEPRHRRPAPVAVAPAAQMSAQVVRDRVPSADPIREVVHLNMRRVGDDEGVSRVGEGKGG